MDIKSDLHALIDELPEPELERLHREARALRARLKAVKDAERFRGKAQKYIGVLQSGLSNLGSNPDHLSDYGR